MPRPNGTQLRQGIVYQQLFKLTTAPRSLRRKGVSSIFFGSKAPIAGPSGQTYPDQPS